MITRYELLSRLKESKKAKDEDVHVTIDELSNLFPSSSRHEVISTILDMQHIKLTDSNLGGIIIPKEYFDGKIPS